MLHEPVQQVKGRKKDCRAGSDRAAGRVFPAFHPRRAASILATSIFFIVIIASNARRASSPPASSAAVSTRGVICHDSPHLSLHQPQSLSCPPLPTIAFQ